MARTQRIVVDALGRLPQFSHAAVSDGLVFVSGTLGTGQGFELVEGGVGPQTTQTMGNLERILAASGASWDDVVKLNVFLADLANGPAMNPAYQAFFAGVDPPARITVGGVDLALGARVEIDCVAQLGPWSHTNSETAIGRRTGFLDHDDEAIYCEVAGEGGVPLVLCHGAGGNMPPGTAKWRRSPVTAWSSPGTTAATEGPPIGPGGPVLRWRRTTCSASSTTSESSRRISWGQSMGGWTVVGAVLGRPGIARRVVLADTLGGFTSAAIEASLARRPPLQLTEDLGLHPALDPSFSARDPNGPTSTSHSAGRAQQTRR